MAKIDARDFGDYVENDNKLRYEILKSKGVNVKPNQNLTYYTNRMQELGAVSEDKYIPDPLFDRMEQEYLNDPLLKINGGIYEDYQCLVVLDIYDSVFLKNLYPGTGDNAKIPTIIKTSDAQYFEITTSTTQLELVWNKDKGVENLKDGRKVRWIKIYTTLKSSGGYSPIYFLQTCYNTLDKSNPSPLLFSIIDNHLGAFPNPGQTYNTKSDYYYTLLPNLEYIIIGKNTPDFVGSHGSISSSGAVIASCYRLVAIKALKPLTFNGRKGEASGVIYYCENLKYFDVKITSFMAGYPIFNRCPKVKLSYDFFEGIDLIDAPISKGIYFEQIPSIPTNCVITQTLFGNVFNDTKILNITQTFPGNNIRFIFSIAPGIEKIIFSEKLYKDINLTGFRGLSNEGLEYIANWLPETDITYTIKFYTYLPINQELITIMQNKNWTVTFAAS